jgi:hypothetical protein
MSNVTFDHHVNVIMSNVQLISYKNTPRRTPTSLIEGKLELDIEPDVVWVPLDIRNGIDRPQYFINDNLINIKNQRFTYARLSGDGSVAVYEPHEAAIPLNDGRDNRSHQGAKRWTCEVYQNGSLTKSIDVTTVNQWNAVRYLLKLRAAQRTKGVLEGSTLTYDTQTGTVVIVRPSTATVESPQIRPNKTSFRL